MPMARSAVLIGRTAADLVRNVVILVLTDRRRYIIGLASSRRGTGLACIALRQRVRSSR